MRTLWSPGVTLTLLLGATGVPAWGQVAVYDEFVGAFIDPQKWVVLQQGGPAHREFVREVRRGRLRLEDRAYGRVNNDIGGSFDGVFLDLPDPQAFSALGANLQVRRFEVVGCANNPFATATRIELHGTFFNTALPTPGSHVNDVRASIQVRQSSGAPDPAGVLRVVASVHHCQDPTCSSVDNLALQDLGPIGVGQRVALPMRWEPDADRFVFQRDQAVFLAPYTVPDGAPSGAQRKGLLLANSVTNCTSAPRSVAFMEAFIDRMRAEQLVP